MVQSDKTVKETLAIDHKGKIRQVPKREDTPTPPNSNEMKPLNETREKEGRDRHRSDIAKAITRERSREI